MPEQFHFIHPTWLLALIPLLLLAWRVLQQGGADNPWRRVVDAQLLPLLTVGRAQGHGRIIALLVATGWIVAVLALADPTWDRRPQPVYQTASARVVVLDLSRTMEATDLKPSRLVRARFKVEDVLAQNAEGQTALVAYAGDAFTVAPLTRDVQTIRELLKVLQPDLMPVQGSRADLGLRKAGELLQQAGVRNGQILLIADEIDADQIAATREAAARLARDGHRVSVLGVGTAQGAPVLNADGQALRDASGKVESFRLDSDALQSVARAGGGQYQAVTDSGQALRSLLDTSTATAASGVSQTDAATKGWQERGPWLAVLLLPLAALAFRRNWLLCVMLLAGVVAQPRPAMASTWDDLWQRQDQQAAQALARKDYADAAALANDGGRRGSAEYKQGHYQAALDNFRQGQGPDSNYNRGNALAKLGHYPDAIAAYERVLKERPRDADALANKAAVEALLKQQQKQQQQQQSNKEQGQQAADAGNDSSKDRQQPDPGKDQNQDKDQGKNQGKDQGKDQDKGGQGSSSGSPQKTAQGDKDSGTGKTGAQGQTSASAQKPGPQTAGETAT
ncbi:MAG: VWA domain-containing protein, partial [Betaproteobacteria bacterium]